MKSGRNKKLGFSLVFAVILIAAAFLIGTGRSGSRTASASNLDSGAADASESESDVVDASGFDDPDTVTLIEAPELTAEEYAEITDTAMAAAASASEGDDGDGDASDDSDESDDSGTESGSTSSADGTTIMSITASWVTEDDEEDGDANRLTLVKTSNTEFSVKIQVTFELSGQYSYDVGEITIMIPKSIFTDRDGNSVGTVTLSVPEAPDSSATFSYTETDEYYILTNTKVLSAASNIMFEISIDDLIPSELIGNGDLEDGETSDSGILKYISDEFYAVIEVVTHEGNVITMTSNSLDASIDTSEVIGTADIKSNGLSTAFPSGWDESLLEALPEGADPDDYVYIEWYSWVSVTGNQEYSMEVTSDATQSGIEGAVILGMYSTYTDLVLNDEESGVMDLTLTDDDYLSSGKTGYYVYTYVAIPKSSLEDGDTYSITEWVTYTLTSLDDGEVTTSSDSATLTYAPQTTDPRSSDAGTAVLNVYKSGGYTYTSALDSLRGGGTATLQYNLTTRAAGSVTVDEETGEVETDGFLMVTDDYELYFNYGSEMLGGEDYDWYSITISKPTAYLWQQYTESGKGYTYTSSGSLSYTTINGGEWGYTAVTDASLIPDVTVEGSEDGETWTTYAVVSWKSGSAAVTTLSGASAAGTTIYFPSGVYYLRTTVTNLDTDPESETYGEVLVDLISYNTSPVVRLLGSEYEQEETESLYTSSDSPTTILRNYVEAALYSCETDEDGSLSIGSKLSEDTATAYDTLTGSSLSVTIEKSMTYENDTSNKTVLLHYTTTVYEHSNLTTLAEYKAALAAGAFEEETSGVFYDLLPVGVEPDVSTVTMNGDGDIVTNIELIEDYQGSGRTMMIVEVSLTPTVSYLNKSVSGTPYSGYCDTFTLEFDAVYSWDSLTDYGTELNNVIAFESGNDSLGTIEGFSGVTADEDAISSTTNNAAASAVLGVEQYMTDLDEENPDALFVYANCATTIDVVIQAEVGISKVVSTNYSGIYSSGLEVDGVFENVYDNGFYTYRFEVLNGSTNAKGIIIYDDLENYVPGDMDSGSDDSSDVQWKGTLLSVDTSLLEELGIDVKVYYTTEEDLELYVLAEDGQYVQGADCDLDSEDSIWQLLTDDTDLTAVTAIAVDCRYLTADEDGDGEPDEFVLGAGETISFTVDMQAPNAAELAEAYNEENGLTGEDAVTAEDFYDVDLDDAAESEAGLSGGAHTYNNVVFVAQFYQEDSGTWGSAQLSYDNYTKVGLLPFEISVEKTFDDGDDQDGLRPDASWIVLLADGVSTLEADGADADAAETITLADGTQIAAVKLSEENSWSYTFTDVTYLNDDGEVISYSFAEYVYDEESGYWVPVEEIGYELGLTWTQDDTGYSYTLSNTHVPETVDITGTKTWDDDDDAAGARPSSVKVSLYANGELVQTKTVSADSSGNWTYTFYDLDRYEDGEEIEYTVQEDVYYAGYYSESDGCDLTNIYYPYGNLSIRKSTVDTTDAEDGVEFSFQVVLYDEDGETDPSAYRYVIYDAEGSEVSSGTFRTGDILKITAEQTIVICDIPSESTYEVTEVNLPDGFTLTGSTGTTGQIYANQTSEAAFTNTYAASGKFILTAGKTLTGRTLSAKQFRFTLTDEDGTVLRTTTNDADGAVTFGALSYTVADAGKTYYYYVSETDAGADGYTYDSAIYTVAVTISDNGDGTLGIDANYYSGEVTAATADSAAAVTAISFANTYEAEGELSLTAWKTLEGGTLSDYTFSFELIDEDGKILGTASCTENGVITFSAISFTQDDVGTHTYTVREVIPDEDDEDYDESVIYDTAVFTYTVTVYDDGDGTLSFDYSVADEEGNEAQPVFENTLEPGVLTVTKTVSEDSDDCDENTTFTFQITLNGSGAEDIEGIDYILSEAEDEDETGEESSGEETSEEDEEEEEEESEDSESSDSDSDSDSDSNSNSDTTEEESSEVTVLASGTTGTVTWVLTSDGTLTFTATDGVSGTLGNHATRETTPWYAYRESITKIANGGGTIKATTLEQYFDGCVNLTDISALAEWDTSELTNLHNTFFDCSSLTDSDLSALADWDVSHVTSFNSTFYGCSSLTDLCALANWDISSATTLLWMFYGCSSLTTLDGLENWNPSSTLTVTRMFYCCTSLTDASAVEGWNMTSVTTLIGMFEGCSSLTTLDLSGWTTTNIDHIYSMFEDCSSLTTLDLSGWDTSKVTQMNSMFEGCSSLTTLDLSGWTTSAVTDMSSLFTGCDLLQSITLGENWGWTGSSSSTAVLPTPQTSLTDEDGNIAYYTGKWVRSDGSMDSCTAAELMANWSASCAGEWVWEEAANKYTVTFDLNAGEDAVSGTVADRYYWVGEDVVLPTVSLYRNGYVFVGWSTKANPSEEDPIYENGETISASDATALMTAEKLTSGEEGCDTVTLYAQWEEATVELEGGVGTFTLQANQTATFEIPAGVSYTIYEITESGWILVASSGTSGVITSNETSEASFSNQYVEDLEEYTTAIITAYKTLDGDAAQEGAYSFTLTASEESAKIDDAVPLPGNSLAEISDADISSVMAANGAGGTVVFDTIYYSQAGTYIYTLAEVIPEEGDDDYDETITYDATVYTVTVTVTEDEDGSLTSEVVYSANHESGEDSDGDSNVVSQATLTNETKPGSLTITKKVTGTSLTDQEFTLTVSYNSGYTTETVTLNSENDWTWTSDDLAAGTTWEITETEIPDGYTLSDISITSPSDTDETETGETFSASGTIEAGVDVAITVTNAYSASGSFGLTAAKTMEGRDLEAGEFSFTVTRTDEDGNALEGEEAYTENVTNESNGDVLFSEITVTETGTWYYTIEEVSGDDDTVNYSSQVFTAVVTATDNGDGTLSCSVSYQDADGNEVTTTDSEGTTGSAAPTFANSLNPGSLSISKTVTGGTSASAEDTFTFVITLMSDEETSHTGTVEYIIKDEDGNTMDTKSVTVSDDGTVTVEIGAGETAELLDLPAGTLYTVEETNLASCYSLTAMTATYGTVTGSGNTASASGTIPAASTAEVHVTNEYTTTGSFSVTVLKNLLGRTLADNEFTFALVDMTEGSKTYGQTVATAANDSDGKVTFTDVELTAEGTYMYMVRELSDADSDGEEDDETIVYSSEVVYVTVTAADAGNGVLSTTVTYGTENPVFTNQVKTADLTIRKTVEGGTSYTVNDTFTFTLTLTDWANQTLTDSYIYTIYDSDGTASATGSIASGGTFALKADQYIVIGDLPLGTTYTVTESELPSGYTAEESSLTGVLDSDTSKTITNTYQVNAGSALIQAQKVLTGRAMEAGEFSFTLTETDETWTAAEDAYTDTVTNAAAEAGVSDLLTFKAISYDTEGTYYYTITEDAGTAGGVTYDNTVIHVTVTVTDDGSGTLQTEISYEGSDILRTFTNSYTAAPVSDTITATKTVTGEGYTMAGGEFTFTLTNAHTDEEIASAANTADGEVTVATLTFTEPGTYVYTLDEEYTHAAGITYDAEIYTITYVVTDNGSGNLVYTKTITTTGSGAADEITFTNSYSPEEITVSLSGLKILEYADGLSREIEDGEFTFTLTETDASGNAVEGGVTMTTTNVGSAFTFADVATFAEAGVRYFLITETAGNDDTISYSTASYLVAVTVTLNESGVLEAEFSHTEKELAFTNTYTPTETSVTISGSKTLTGRSLAAGEFTFVLTDESGETAATAVNTATGGFTFPSLTFTEPGSYVYTVNETAGEAGGVTYDDAVYTICIEVTENTETHALEAAVTYYLGTDAVTALSFTNGYTASPVAVSPGAAKVLTGGTLTAGQFTFTLSNADGKVIDTKTNDADGLVVFDAIVFEEAGTYEFSVSEVDDGQDNVTFDSSVHTITVVVTDDGEGALTAEMIYDGDEEASAPVFVNTYEEETTTVVETTSEEETTTEVETTTEEETTSEAETTTAVETTSADEAETTTAVETTSADETETSAETTEETSPESATSTEDAGDSGSASTGDGSNLGMWMILAAAALVSMALAAMGKKRAMK